MAITAQQVKDLRNKTGAGMMDCKKALTEANGDMEAAIDFLRKKGQKVAALRAGKEAKEGVVIAQTTSDNTRGIIVNISCETDFVARNEDFISFVKSIADVAIESRSATLEDLLNASLDGLTVSDKLAEKVGTIGENISLAAFETLEDDCVVSYIHAGYKIGVLVGLNKKGQVEDIAKDVAMQVAAMDPVSLDESSVPQDIKDRELAIGREKALAEGKPENIVDRIAEGTLKKFYKDNTLVNQQFVKDNKKTVAQAVAGATDGLKITSFKRVSLG